MARQKADKENREELRAIMKKYRLGSKHVAPLLHTSQATIRTYCSNYGADISKANLELLLFKVGEKPSGEIKNVDVS